MYIFQGSFRKIRVSTLQMGDLNLLGFFCVLVSYHANRSTVTLKIDAFLSFLCTKLNARASTTSLALIRSASNSRHTHML